MIISDHAIQPCYQLKFSKRKTCSKLLIICQVALKSLSRLDTLPQLQVASAHRSGGGREIAVHTLHSTRTEAYSSIQVRKLLCSS
jgi:hypothetical protein